MTRKLEAGGQEQFTLVTSINLDENPLFFIRDFQATLVYSSAAASSGSGHYYEFATIPSSRGMFTFNWFYTLNANTFVEAGMFEVVQTLAAETTGLYCNANEVKNLYQPLVESRMRNHEVDEFIQGIMAEVNGKIGHVYNVSSLQGNPIINTITKNLTLVSILERRPEVPEWVANRRDRFHGMLEALAAGSMYLVTSGGAVITPSVTATVSQVDHSMENYTPTFNMLDPEYQRVDPDRTNDEEDAL